MKSHQPPPRARAAVSNATSADEELAPSNAAVQEQLKSGGGDWQDDLLAMVLAHGPAPAPVTAAPSPEEQARHDASVASVWRMMLPNTAGRTDAELAAIRAPVIDGPSLEEQAQWDREWAARPEFQNRASEAPQPAVTRPSLDWMFGKKG